MKALLFYNSPKARRYFQALQHGLREHGWSVELAPIGIAHGRPLAEADAQVVSAYSLQRKQARARIPLWRIRLFAAILRQFARWHWAAASWRIARQQPDVVGVWGGQSVDARAVRLAATQRGVPCCLFETGLLPGTTTCDFQGVNANNSVPRSSLFYACRPEPRALISPEIRPRKAPTGEPEPLPRHYVFVPFQVALDSQVLLYSPWLRNMHALYYACSAALAACPGDLHLVFKPHPSCRQQYPDLIRDAARQPRLHIVQQHTTADLIGGSAGVITLNSSVGLEALVLDRPVLTLGQACYAIPGVTQSASDAQGLVRWLQARAHQQPQVAPLRSRFLDFLARDYCIPGLHTAVDAAHCAALAQRWTSALSSTDLARWPAEEPMSAL